MVPLVHLSVLHNKKKYGIITLITFWITSAYMLFKTFLKNVTLREKRGLLISKHFFGLNHF